MTGQLSVYDMPPIVNQPADEVSSEECSIDVTESFERLEIVGGQVLHRLYVNSRIGDIRPDECIVFSDGRRTEGCSRDEFLTYVSGSIVLHLCICKCANCGVFHMYFSWSFCFVFHAYVSVLIVMIF